MKLSNIQLQEIYGGEAAGLIILGLALMTTLIVGIIDGLVRPLKCHE
ncbi:MAG: hypothetical protein HFH86_00480 [Bacilli bacterium]|jgi:hypothetical protein|nr:hypothetical protein [Bacilli bacterium]